jgi:hypothetical protein
MRHAPCVIDWRFGKRYDHCNWSNFLTFRQSGFGNERAFTSVTCSKRRSSEAGLLSHPSPLSIAELMRGSQTLRPADSSAPLPVKQRR